jgi:hypothetical protein
MAREMQWRRQFTEILGLKDIYLSKSIRVVISNH